jgi:hypothetical protein
MSNLTSVGHISINEFKQEYFKLLTNESKELFNFLSPYYSQLEVNQHPIPTVLINWFKDTALNYQNLLHQMKVTKYSISKIEEKTITKGDTNRGYQERFNDKYKDGNKEVKITGFTNYEVFNGTHGKQNSKMKIPPEFSKYMTQMTQSGGELHDRRFSRAKSMFRDYGNHNKMQKKYNNKINFLKDSKPYLIKALLHLYNEYKETQSKESDFYNILSIGYPLESDKEIVFKFMEDVSQDKLSLSQMAEWFNYAGKLLVREFSYLLTNNKLDLPYELKKRMNYNPTMYNEFFPLVIQDYVEKRLNKRYEFSVEIQSGYKETDKLKLDLEVLSKSYFEPIEFPVFFDIKASGNDSEYNKFIKQQQSQKGGGGSMVSKNKRRKNISFTLARFLLVQNIHMPWIKIQDINAKILMTPFKKQLPFNPTNRLLGANEINSGSRYINNINIWRREELNKLIIHESIHQAEVDFNYDIGFNSFLVDNMAIDPNNEIRLYESYTETCAVLINLMVSTYEMFLIHHKWDKYSVQLRNHFIDPNKQKSPSNVTNHTQRVNSLNQQPRQVSSINIDRLKPATDYISYKTNPKRRTRTKPKNKGITKSKFTTNRRSKPKFNRRSGRNNNRSKPKSRRSSGRRTGRINNTKRKSKGSIRGLLKSKMSQSGGLVEGYSLDLMTVIEEIKKVFMVSIRMEQLFTAFQVAKVLNFYGFKSMEEFLSPDTTDKRINQETSVLSYFIIKGGLLNSIDKFVMFIIKMNSDMKDPIMNFKFNSSNDNDYKELIKECVINNVGYHKSINKFIEIIRETGIYPKEKTSINEFNIAKTLRMSLIEVADEMYSY